MQVWLFMLGLAIGSFLNVLSLRYNPDKFLLDAKIMGGRSSCPSCGNKLKWFELVPLLSFIWLRGRCRKCKRKISFQYPVVELISGLMFIFIPQIVSGAPLQIIWTAIFVSLLLISLIDIRLRLIPDEASAFVAILGIPIIFLTSPNFSLISGSFLGSYAGIFGLRGNIWANHGAALFFGAAFFIALILITRGRGMGMGDLKLAAALGFVFGWPDIVLITALSFILGSLFSLPSLIVKKKGMKSLLPFGPFLVLASLVVYFFGYNLMDFYFKLFNLV